MVLPPLEATPLGATGGEKKIFSLLARDTESQSQVSDLSLSIRKTKREKKYFFSPDGSRSSCFNLKQDDRATPR